jgi:hypothetical protein
MKSQKRRTKLNKKNRLTKYKKGGGLVEQLTGKSVRQIFHGDKKYAELKGKEIEAKIGEYKKTRDPKLEGKITTDVNKVAKLERQIKSKELGVNKLPEFNEAIPIDTGLYPEVKQILEDNYSKTGTKFTDEHRSKVDSIVRELESREPVLNARSYKEIEEKVLHEQSEGGETYLEKKEEQLKENIEHLPEDTKQKQKEFLLSKKAKIEELIRNLEALNEIDDEIQTTIDIKKLKKLLSDLEKQLSIYEQPSSSGGYKKKSRRKIRKTKKTKKNRKHRR